jgi:hypothetical protein
MASRRRSTPATRIEAAAVAAGVVASLGVIALSVFPALGWAIVIGTPLLAVVSAAMAAALADRGTARASLDAAESNHHTVSDEP